MMTNLFLFGLSTLFQVALLQPPTGSPTKPNDPAAASKPQDPSTSVPSKATDAEKIANGRESVKQAKNALEKLQKQVDDPAGEYHKAEADFESLNEKLKTLKMTAAKLRKEGKESEAVKAEAGLPGLQEDWKLAKDRFDIAIRQKKAILETIAGLKERIASDTKRLDRLEGKTPPPEKPVPAEKPTTTSPAPSVPAQPTNPTATVERSPTPVAVPPGLSPLAVPTLPAPASTTVQPAANLLPAANETDPVVRQAHERLNTHRVELQNAEARVRSAEERVRVMERSIKNATTILGLERETVDQAEKSAERLSTTLKTQPPATPAERTALTQKLQETNQRLTDSRSKVQRIADRIASLNETLTGLKAELAVHTKEADERRKQVTDSEAELNSLQSPTAPRNLFRWVYAKGPRLLLILLGMGVIHMLVRQFSRHIVRFITRNGQRGSVEDRENRASTLVGVFRYAAGIAVFGGGLVMLLDEVGVPVVPLMGGAAVIGLAVAFGAQNLIRDYFTGFMMLMEDQYSVNDVVRIGSISGLVELITLRMTVLRDLEGVRHFIPHGAVTSVSNLTHGWSRALLDVPVAYKENVDRVIDVLMELGREMRHHPVLGKHILEEPEMLGVDSFADSAVVIRFLLKTRPLQQWPIKREMLRRIKNRFDELGIEIPFPHRTIYHHYPEGMAGQTLPLTVGDRYVA
ncbi:MAG TPA: mechanosensitive ion channel domain-containing protein [Fimbriiglobus sp.]